MSEHPVKKKPLYKYLIPLFLSIPLIFGTNILFRQNTESTTSLVTSPAEISLITEPPLSVDEIVHSYVKGKITYEEYKKLLAMVDSKYTYTSTPPIKTSLKLFFSDAQSNDDLQDVKRGLTTFPIKIEFPNGRSFNVIKQLGKGGVSVIYETSDGKALRITTNRDQALDLQRFRDIYNDLVKHKVPVVNTDFSGLPYYALHDKVNIKRTLADWNDGGWEKEGNAQPFIQFVKELSDYTYIEDLSDRNAVQLTDGHWMVLDVGQTAPNEGTRPNEDVIHFKYNKYGPRLRELLKQKDQGTFNLNQIDYPEYIDLTANVFTDPQDTVISQWMMRIPMELEDPIRLATLNARMEHMR